MLAAGVSNARGSIEVNPLRPSLKPRSSDQIRSCMVDHHTCTTLSWCKLPTTSCGLVPHLLETDWSEANCNPRLELGLGPTAWGICGREGLTELIALWSAFHARQCCRRLHEHHARHTARRDWVPAGAPSSERALIKRHQRLLRLA